MFRRISYITTLCLASALAAGCGSAPSDGPQPPGSGRSTTPGPSATPAPSGGWTLQPVSGAGEASARSPANLTDISASRHDTYDRVVFEFSGALPDYRAQYVDNIQQPGSGGSVDLRGDQTIQLTFTNVARVAGRELTPGLPAVPQLRQFATFEGTVDVGVGVATAASWRLPYRVRATGNQISLDVEHAGPVTQPSASPSSASPSPSPSSPSPSPPGTPDESLLRRGDTGDQVRAVQRRLAELGYWVGPVDGRFGELTEQAVYAVQKAAGITRDGIVGPDTRSALERGVRPSARTDDGRVVEVDLDRQLLMLVDDGRVEHIFHTSTGTFEYYMYDGERYLADTPRGRWEIYRQVDAWDPGPLGRLYRPKYFNRQGIAVHGFPSVPPYPASHGCVRVSIAAMDWMWRTDQLPIGTPVRVY